MRLLFALGLLQRDIGFGWISIGADAATPVFDVTGTLPPVTAVSEPSTWAMMLLGFAGLGFAGYGRAGKGGPRNARGLAR
ncbi:MAG: PEP-CTERM sorting domain-containing protein [Roseiarcus sp.]